MLQHKVITIITALFLVSGQVYAQKSAEINITEHTYDFGSIAEADGLATHSFTIQNTGTDPLVITRITASCGCTRPEYSKAPIEPGQTAEIKISYNPKGRPGPFHKSVSVFSNAKNGKQTLYVKGSVKPKPTQTAKAVVSYPYGIGGLKLQTKTIQYSSIRPGETLGEKIGIKNEGEHPVTVKAGKTPNYLTAEIRPSTLEPGETGEITLLFNTDLSRKMGRITTVLPLTVESGGKKKGTEGTIEVAANVIDNFSKWSATDKANAPVIQFSATSLDFGKLPEKGGSIIPFIGGGGKESENLIITNTGKTPLSVYSVTCDNDHVDISGGKKELKPGASAEYKVSVRPKDIKTKLEAFINVVCNDPNSPVRLIKVTAEK